MRTEFIPYELASKLIDLGFDNKQFFNLAFVNIDNEFYLPKEYVPNSAIWTPLWQQAFDWLLELTNYKIIPIVSRTLDNKYYCSGIICDTIYDANKVKLKRLIEIYESNNKSLK